MNAIFAKGRISFCLDKREDLIMQWPSKGEVLKYIAHLEQNVCTYKKKGPPRGHECEDASK
jgi:hypothetical protein